MTLDDLKELLPLYVAGLLSAEQKAIVEEGLKQHPELREERRFWEGIRRATLLDAPSAAQDHLTAEQIVQYAEGGMPPGEERLFVERHLQTCATCREELSLLRQVPEGDVRPVHAASEKKRRLFFAGNLGRIRPAFVVAVLAIVAVIAIYLRYGEQPPQQAATPATPKETARVVPPRAEQVRRIAYTLPFSGTLRQPFATRSGTPVLTLHDSVTWVDLSVLVEHSAIAAGYVVDLTIPGGAHMQFADTINPVGRSGSLDTLLVSAGRERFTQSGKYVLRVREILKEGIKNIEPEEYHYEFDVRRTPPP